MDTGPSSLEKLIEESIEKINKIIERELPALRASQAKSLFDAEGAYNGRGEWKPLAESTIKRKGNSRRMYDTGQLYDLMTDSSTFENDNWESLVPDKYESANAEREFMDIGSTEEDLEDIANKLEEKIKNEFN